jgi:hypothetical protein
MSMKDAFFFVFALSGLLIGFGLPAITLLLTWLTPKSVIDQFVRPPHFSEFESIAYRYFPSSYIRTLLFTMAISIRVFRKVRQFGDIHKQVPAWFNIASRIFVYVVLGYCMLWVCTFVVLVVMAKLQQ